MLALCFPATSGAEEYFDRYGLAPASPAVDLGVQPLGYPSGVISAVMRRDRILKKALADSRQPLKTHPFRRGADMVALLAERRLEAGLLGDMPTILAAAGGNVWIAGLVKQTSTAIVTKGDTQARGLAGKRIGYVEASSAHHTLLQGLASAGLDETRVKLVALRIDDMPDALERGDIDAFAAWEPAPSIALKNSNKNHIVFRGLSTDYFVIERDFESARRRPRAMSWPVSCARSDGCAAPSAMSTRPHAGRWPTAQPFPENLRRFRRPRLAPSPTVKFSIFHRPRSSCTAPALTR